jgi:hypothetical protein
MIYTMSVSGLYVADDVDGHLNVVTAVVWVLTGTDGTYTATATGTDNIGPAHLENFVPYEDLTEEFVLTWIPNYGTALSPFFTRYMQYQAGIWADILQQKGATIALAPTLPWS